MSKTSSSVKVAQVSRAKRLPHTLLATRAALSLDAHEAVLGYLRHLPEHGRRMRELAEMEEVVLERFTTALNDLRSIRAKAHGLAFDGWSEAEISDALASLAAEGTTKRRAR